MSLHKQYRRDKTTVWVAPTDGVEIECSLFDPRQPDYINVMTRITKPVRKIIEQNLLKPADDRKYAVRAFVETCVKNWRTIVEPAEHDENGRMTKTAVYKDAVNVSEDDAHAEWVPYSIDAAVTLFTKYPQFYTDTVELARDLATYQTTEEELKKLRDCLTYQLRTGQHEAQLVKAALQAGHPLPKEIADAPELLPTLRLFWTCYFDLRRGKDIRQPLPWWEVQLWCDTHNVDSELTLAVHKCTLELDDIWLSLQPKAENNADTSGNKRR